MVTNGENWRYWLKICKWFISIHTSLWWILRHEEAYFEKYLQFCHLYPTRTICLWIWDIFSPIWPLVTSWISDNWWKRFISIHTSLSWILGHILVAYLEKYWSFCNLYPPWDQFLMNLGYCLTYLATGDKSGTIVDIGCKCIRFISTPTSLCDLRALRKHIWKNIDDFLNCAF